MILNIPDIAIGGLNTDASPWDLPPEMISNGMNFRIGANAIVTYGGIAVYDTSIDKYKPGFAIMTRTPAGSFIVTAGTSIYAYNVSYQDISDKVVPDGDEYLWSGCLSGSVVILNNSNASPVYWNGSEPKVLDLPWDTVSDGSGGTIKTTWKEEGYSASVVRSHKNYLIAMDLTDATTRPDGFRWSHPSDENGIPFTWNPNNTAGLAGVQSLGGDGGRIIDGLSLRDSFVIYSRNAINILDLSGDEFVWRRRELSSTIGILSRDCVVESKGLHYILTSGDIVTFDGNSIVSIAHDKIQTILRLMNTDYIDRAFVYSNEKRKEIWFCIPYGQDNTGKVYENANLAIIYQWKKGTWSLRELPIGTSFVIAAPEIVAPGEPWGDEVSGDQQAWEDDETRWNDDVSAVSFANKPYAINHDDSRIDILEPTITENDLNTFIERTDLAIESQINVTTLTRIYPHAYGSKPFRIRVGSQDRAGGVVRWKGWKVFDPSKDRKIDVRTTGALHCYRIESIGTGKFRFAGLDIEYEVDGVR